MVDINTAGQRFRDGVNSGAASKWLNRTKGAAQTYNANFANILAAQVACGQSVRGQGGYDALAAYAACMQGGARGAGG